MLIWKYSDAISQKNHNYFNISKPRVKYLGFSLPVT